MKSSKKSMKPGHEMWQLKVVKHAVEVGNYPKILLKATSSSSTVLQLSFCQDKLISKVVIVYRSIASNLVGPVQYRECKQTTRS